MTWYETYLIKQAAGDPRLGVFGNIGASVGGLLGTEAAKAHETVEGLNWLLRGARGPESWLKRVKVQKTSPTEALVQHMAIDPMSKFDPVNAEPSHTLKTWSQNLPWYELPGMVRDRMLKERVPFEYSLTDLEKQRLPEEVVKTLRRHGMYSAGAGALGLGGLGLALSGSPDRLKEEEERRRMA
jgi:hypothetical protein